MDPICAGKAKRDPMVGKRIELHPGCDLWMRGARFGKVVSVMDDDVMVRMDHPSISRLVRIPRDRVTEVV